MLAIEDTRYGVALERNGVLAEQRGRVRGLRAAARHFSWGGPIRALERTDSEGRGKGVYIRRHDSIQSERVPWEVGVY